MGPAKHRQRFTVLVMVCCLLLIPWTLYLAATLPRHYVATHWRLTWVGLDVALIVGLALTAWRAYRRRPSLATTAVVTATLLTVDAWLDVTTASGRTDRIVSLASALLAELPLATLLIVAAHRSRRALANNGPQWTIPTGQSPADPPG